MSAADTAGTSGNEPSDPELIARVRDGDVEAYGQLFARHVDAATRLARILVGAPDADDLVSEAFVKVLDVLLAGGGPDVAFRAYLLTAVRRRHIDKVRAGRRLTTAGDLTPYDPGVPFVDPAVASFEGGAAARAFASLPERWQMVLWHLEVENSKPADVAPLLGISANSVSALAYRAREGLRQAFLTMHAGDLPTGECRETHDLLGGYVRNGLSRRDTAKVEEHLDHCRPCTALYLELAEVNSSLSGLLGPVVLGGAAAAYAGTVGGGVVALLAQAKALVLANLPLTITTASVGVAGIVTGVVVTTTGPSPQRAEAGPPPPGVTPSASPSPTATATEQPVSPARPRRTASPAAAGTPVPTAPTGSPAPTSPTASAEPGGTGGATATPGPGSGSGSGSGEDSQGRPRQGSGNRTSDTTVRAAPGTVQDGRATVTVTVGGVPRGQRATVRVSGSASDFTVTGSGCQQAGSVTTCRVPGPGATLTVRASGRGVVTLSVRVTAPAGWTDPDTGNNTATATLKAAAD